MRLKRSIYITILLGFTLLLLVYLKLSAKVDDFEVSIIQNTSNLDSIDFKAYNKIKVSATNAYKSDVIKTILQGNNYRKTWETSIEVPILFLDTLYNGVDIVKEGGGTQTKSLRLKASNGLLLTLRSINKNPEALIPDYVRNLGLENVVIDGISGQHPYAAIVVSRLADAINILHTDPELVFLPRQSALTGRYSNYANKLYVLEYENKGLHNWTKYDNVLGIFDTEDLQKLKYNLKYKLSIDKPQLIRARLFDIVIGDWDRHAKQWGWVVVENDSVYNAIPLPSDRDNAFFNVDGIINKIIEHESVTPHLQSFDEDIQYIKGLVYDFDVYFLQNTSNHDFLTEAKYIQKHLTDDKIELAFKAWNDTIYKNDAEAIINIIKTRRDNLLTIALKFKSELDAKPLLNEPLKGSEYDDAPGSMLQCFEC